MFCPRCGAKIQDAASFCSACGAPVQGSSQGPSTLPRRDAPSWPVSVPRGSLPVPAAPYGIEPHSGEPYSHRSKVAAGLLQIFLPGLGIGRFYTGHVSMGIAQLLVSVFTCGLGTLWPFIDGFLILLGDSRDAEGRPLRGG